MIRFDKVGKDYGQKQVLGEVSVAFPGGQITSLIGPNGAGKSTLLMLLARLHKPSRGTLSINGRDIQQWSQRDYAKQVATLRQSPDFNLRLTVQELVAFGRFPYSRGNLTAEDEQIIEQALEFLSLIPLRSAYIDELSGGQRQMAFLAMTIAQQTPYILLDEPLNNLDMPHAVQIMRALRRLCDEQGRTVIMVVHDINFAANYSDHIVAIKQGALHCCGSVQQVINPDQLQDLYGLQFEILQSSRGFVCNYFNPSS
ncbi:ABC transporter ATP-binding protein [Pseudomonas sp. 5P_3.1_Bac2]|uniref:iron ABC transporter ATP-binding protein n=1 Tax=Pseudomonas sp. 5P_3.1_Bac2 TaxID=2971617 RepID=UPI0021C8F273|nr:ATP-binding cassette domain-containing protein [Pseudomonas sp. 5P_3.1_Bac2]MCU1717147.1 ATP-binding cassette domain-containing protein [Pseudomonas sp. 5P_3.1_Bac2]